MKLLKTNEFTDLLVDWAIKYLQRYRWSVIPVGADKRPLGEWKSFQTNRMSTDTAEKVFRDPRCFGIALITGALSGATVIDIEKDGLTLLQQNPSIKFPESTWQSRSGGGGKHYFFLYGGERNTPISIGKQHVGDVRGEGGYIILPPSMHPSGNFYEWLSPTHLRRQAIPAQLWNTLIPPKKILTPQQLASKPALTAEEGVRRFLDKAVERCARNGRNETGLWLACQLRDLGLSKAEVQSHMLVYQSHVATYGKHIYAQEEAIATVGQVFSRSAREAPRQIAG